MKEIVQKLNTIKNQILLEKKESSLRLFVLIARNDLEGKWDLLFCADWLEKTNSENDLIYVIEKLQNEFGSNLDFLARIILGTPKDSFIKSIAKAIEGKYNNNEESEEIINTFILPTLTINRMFLIHYDFEGINLELGTSDGPLGVKDLTSFE